MFNLICHVINDIHSRWCVCIVGHGLVLSRSSTLRKSRFRLVVRRHLGQVPRQYLFKLFEVRRFRIQSRLQIQGLPFTDMTIRLMTNPNSCFVKPLLRYRSFKHLSFQPFIHVNIIVGLMVYRSTV